MPGSGTITMTWPCELEMKHIVVGDEGARIERLFDCRPRARHPSHKRQGGEDGRCNGRAQGACNPAAIGTRSDRVHDLLAKRCVGGRYRAAMAAPLAPALR